MKLVKLLLALGLMTTLAAACGGGVEEGEPLEAEPTEEMEDTEMMEEEEGEEEGEAEGE